MRLIDAQLVLKLIEDIQYDDRYSNNNEVFVALETVRDCVFNLPAAYDVGRVIDELTARKEEWERGCDEVKALENTQGFDLEGLWRNLSGRAYGTKEAIEIVRRGGIDGEQYLHIARGNGKSGLCYTSLTDQFEKEVK